MRVYGQAYPFRRKDTFGDNDTIGDCVHTRDMHGCRSPDSRIMQVFIGSRVSTCHFKYNAEVWQPSSPELQRVLEYQRMIHCACPTSGSNP